MPRVFALLPAAGFSRRMGRSKLGLPLGTSTVLEQAVQTLGLAGIEPILVVLGPHVADLEPLAERAGATVLLLAESTPDMRATVEKGLLWLEATQQPDQTDAWLLCPADHPLLDAEVIRQIVAGWHQPMPRSAATQKASIVVPTYAGRRGHPTLIGWQQVSGIRAHPPDQGLNSYLRDHQEETLELAVSSEMVLCDLDTPEDYARLLLTMPVKGQTGL